MRAKPSGERERERESQDDDERGLDLTAWFLDPLSDRPVVFEGGISWGCRRRRRKKNTLCRQHDRFFTVGRQLLCRDDVNLGSERVCLLQLNSTSTHVTQLGGTLQLHRVGVGTVQHFAYLRWYHCVFPVWMNRTRTRMLMMTLVVDGHGLVIIGKR